MIKNLAFILTLVSGVICGQNTRIVYQVSMKTDSATAPTVENAYLDVSGDKSFFYGEKRIQRDSLMQRNFQTRNFNFDRSQMEQYRTQINYQVEKDLSAQKITFKNRIARDLYSYDEDRSFNWKILPETTKIGEYKVQKAETDFAGRKWTAWFTQDIPVMDGPYKFSGLPGLIVKVEDAKGDYSFDLKETKKIGELPNLNQQRGGSTVAVKRKDYEKQMEKFRKDPVSFMNAGNGGAPAPPVSASGAGGGGFRMQMDPQRIKEMEARMKEEQKKNNNPIERVEVK